LITRRFARIYCLANMIDSLKKLAIAVIVLVVGVGTLISYFVSVNRKINMLEQANERLTASEKVHLEEIDKMKKVNQLYKEQAEKSKKELAQIKKVVVKKDAEIVELAHNITSSFDYE